ncbi:tetratricopeptide repeat protein [Actinomadura rupiterrae]|uniref:tetratricopeptide repeat protein n=1 Tax=Actinomadura rupiterrae TaxID=559627 RepID=UPI0020A476A2|nr:hypothetical protein [Actinomadura rupiterrae]MCP2336613.1 hypothetical protein [Actinomadura rupiterrae]
MDGLEHACDMLRYCWRAVVNDGRDTDDLGDAFEETRRLYQAADRPDDPALTTGLAVLAFTRLQAHVQAETLMPLAWGASYDEGEPLEVLDEGDEPGRFLAAESVRAAHRALDIDPDDNLAAFTLGLTHEMLGDTAGAVDAYLHALRTYPGDDDIVLRLEALGAEPPPLPDDLDVCRHSQGFFLLTINARFSNSEWGDWVHLLSDQTRLRPIADEITADYHWESSFEDGDDDRWDPRSPAFAPSPDHNVTLIVHRPGTPETSIDLYRALRRSRTGRSRSTGRNSNSPTRSPSRCRRPGRCAPTRRPTSPASTAPNGKTPNAPDPLVQQGFPVLDVGRLVGDAQVEEALPGEVVRGE